MLVITLDLLSSRYIATSYNDRTRVEWPPHPARLFSALVATWADDPDLNTADTLRWLEQQDPPKIYASADPCARTVVTVYVPVNDTTSLPTQDKIEKAEASVQAAKTPQDSIKAQKKLRELTEDPFKAATEPSKSDTDAAQELFPDRRGRQARTFPCATPAAPVVAFLWPSAEPSPAHAQALQGLLSRLIRLGHSSSFVRAALDVTAAEPSPPPDTVAFTPDPDAGDLVVRWVGPGQFDRLQDAFTRHQETEPRVLPARFFRYSALDRPASLLASPPHSVFAPDGVVFARVEHVTVKGRSERSARHPITAAVGISRQLRRALMACADQPPPPLLSGHDDDATSAKAQHLAIVPLPVVNAPHAEGTILGVALLFPRGCDSDARAAVMRAVARLEAQQAPTDGFDAPVVPLLLGEGGVLGLQRVAWGDEDRRSTLRLRTWCQPAKVWASATPVALDRNPGDLHHTDPGKRRAAFDNAEAIIAEAVQRIGLPAPAEVQVHRSCVVTGSAKPMHFRRFPPNEARLQRVLVHVRLRFDAPVAGPLLIGAGRNYGLGLCVPLLPR